VVGTTGKSAQAIHDPRPGSRGQVEKTSMKIKRIEHVAIAVRNLDAVRDTLGKLGIACDYEETLPASAIRLAMLPIGESAIELLEPQSEAGATAAWLREKGEGLYHICLEVDDIDAALAELRAKDVKLLDEVPRSGHGGHRIAFIDPASTAGILIELVEMTGAH
jgi:methylmalonyl-CoA epimerase